MFILAHKCNQQRSEIMQFPYWQARALQEYTVKYYEQIGEVINDAAKKITK